MAGTNQMRITVTGGLGFIGSHVVDGLLAVGHEVEIIDSTVAAGTDGSEYDAHPNCKVYRESIQDHFAAPPRPPGSRPAASTPPPPPARSPASRSRTPPRPAGGPGGSTSSPTRPRTSAPPASCSTRGGSATRSWPSPSW